MAARDGHGEDRPHDIKMISGVNILLNPRVTGERHTLVNPQTSEGSHHLNVGGPRSSKGTQRSLLYKKVKGNLRFSGAYGTEGARFGELSFTLRGLGSVRSRTRPPATVSTH